MVSSEYHIEGKRGKIKEERGKLKDKRGEGDFSL
jgi:hypothetical protein